jgi:hypothetical protein
MWIKRAYGTRFLLSSLPGVETPGYYQRSLRDPVIPPPESFPKNPQHYYPNV